MSKGYELQLVATDPDSPYPNEWMLSFWATLSGLDRETIWEACPLELRKDKGWGGADMRKLAEKLGMNAAPRFSTFDPATPWPAILRYRKTAAVLAAETKQKQLDTGNPKAKAPDYWYAAIYNQGEVWQPDCHPAVCQLEGWLQDHSNYRITSMLSVWWGDDLHLTQKDFV